MRERISAIWLIQLFIGIFFAASALIILTGYNSAGSEFMRGVNKMFGKNNSWTLVVAILELLSGIVLIAGLFVSTQQRLMFMAGLVIFILWSLNILTLYFFGGFLKPSFMVWVRDLSLQLVVLAGLWGVMMESR